MERVTPLVVAVLLGGFSAWTGLAWTHPGPGPARMASPAALEGKAAWLRHNCQACHQTFGLGGYLGPDLTNAMERRGPAYVRMILRDGRGQMPRLPLEPREIDALVEYLDHVNRTGVFPPKGPRPAGFNN
jgi:nitric oxide reductase subunit C